jgi:2,5-furandicarboxylate decarboxylase 1
MDLQSFLHQYEADYPDRVWHIRAEVPRDHFTTAATLEAERMLEPPVLVFERVSGLDMPVVTGLFSSRSRIAYAIGTTAERLHEHWTQISQNLIPPVEVSSGLCQEVCYLGDEANAEMLPLMTHFEQDAGRYVTSGVSIAKDPDHGWGNLSFARMQLQGPRQFGISVHSRGHLWDYQRRAEARGQDLELAVVIGMHPAFLIGAASRVGIDIDEYDIAGALLGRPLELVQCKTVDLRVPAQAEIILEGVIEANRREPEGPFGEYTGYSTDRSTQNVFKLQAITHRTRPYFLDVCPGASRDHLFLGRVQKEAEVLRKMRQVLPNVTAIHYPTSGTHYHCYIALKKQRPGDGRHAAVLALGLDAYIKFVVVVDADIDISNEAEVMWALATRMQPDEDITIVDKMTCNVLDPSSDNGLSSKLAIDATRPLDWEPQRCTIPTEIAHAARELISSHLRDIG